MTIRPFANGLMMTHVTTHHPHTHLNALIIKAEEGGMSSPAENPPHHHRAACLEEAPTRLLHDSASHLISFSHACFEKITHLPFPMGTIIKCVEGVVDPWTHPLVEALECHGLNILAAMDDKIYAIGTFVEGCVFCTAARLKVVSTLLFKRGLIGTSADLWLKYEATVKEDIQKAVRLANKFPLVNLATPLFCAISTPLARAISDWLVKQGERIDKGMEVTNDSFVVQKEQVEHDCLTTELKGSSYMEVVHIAGKDVDMDDVDVGVREGKDVDADVDVDAGVRAEKTAEEPVGSIEEEDYLPDVLEMIDSSWLLGMAAASSLHKKTTNPSGSGSKLKRRIFNR